MPPASTSPESLNSPAETSRLCESLDWDGSRRLLPRQTALDHGAGARVVFICINGIRSNPGDAEGWTDRAVTWLNLHTAAKSEKFEYACGALTRRLKQGARAQAIARMAGFYIAAGYEVVFVAHSNGGDLVERVLRLIWPVRIRSAHLFAPACTGEHLARALDPQSTERGAQLGILHLYGSENDRALWLGALSRKLLGWVGLGYGDLGRHITAFGENHPRVIAHEDSAKDHDDWFTRGEEFERSMRAIVTHEFIAPF